MNDEVIQSILAGIKEVIRLRDKNLPFFSDDKCREAELTARDIDKDIWALVEYLEGED